jgi:hypothetical protein
MKGSSPQLQSVIMLLLKAVLLRAYLIGNLISASQDVAFWYVPLPGRIPIGESLPHDH